MAAHSSILAWEVPWTEEPGGQCPWGRQEADMTEWLTLWLSKIYFLFLASYFSCCLFCLIFLPFFWYLWTVFTYQHLKELSPQLPTGIETLLLPASAASTFWLRPLKFWQKNDWRYKMALPYTFGRKYVRIGAGWVVTHWTTWWLVSFFGREIFTFFRSSLCSGSQSVYY